MPADAPTQQRNYYHLSATARKEMPAGFEGRTTKVFAKHGAELTDADILTVAARRWRRRKLEHVKGLEEELEQAKDGELWNEWAIAAEIPLKQHKSAYLSSGISFGFLSVVFVMIWNNLQGHVQGCRSRWTIVSHN